MLRPKQEALFKLLDINPAREKEMRAHHKLCKQIGASHDFTRWLEQCLRAKWRRENERSRPMYVGD